MLRKYRTPLENMIWLEIGSNEKDELLFKGITCFARAEYYQKLKSSKIKLLFIRKKKLENELRRILQI